MLPVTRGLLWPPRGLTLLTFYFACLGPCVAFPGRRVALLRLLCFLSWPLRGIPWPPRGLASPKLLPVAWPGFAYFASCHAWPSVTAAWPYFAHFLLCFMSWPRRGLPCRRVALLRLLCFPSWPLCGLPWPPRGLTLPPRGLTLLTFLLAVLAPAWPSVAPRVLASLTLLPAWPSVAAAWPKFAHVASCLGPCVAFRGCRVALLCSRCFLSWPLRGLPWPPLGLTLLTLPL